MADNTNPQAVKFANEKARVLADALVTAIETATKFKGLYDAASMDTIFPATADNIADGSDVDGRGRVTNNAIRALYTVASNLITWGGTGTPTRLDQLRNIAVNGVSRY